MKRKMRLGLVFLVTFGMTLTIGWWRSALAKDEVVQWKITHVVLDEHPFAKTAVFIKDRVEKATDGKFTFKIFGRGTLGDEVQTMDLYKTGDVDMGFHYSASAASVIKEVGLLNFPFLFQSESEWEKFMATPKQKAYWASVVEQKKPGFTIGAIGTHGTKDLYTKNKKINTLADFKGLKFRVTPSPTLVEAWRLIGAEPRAMAYAEVYSAIQTGLLDGADNAPTGYYNGKHYEVAKIYNFTQHEVPSTFLFVREAAYRSLPENYRIILDQALVECQPRWIQWSKEYNGELVNNRFPKDGVTVHKVPEELRKDLQKIVAPNRDRIARELNLMEFVTALDEFRAKEAK